jgi:hypothetical protein
VPQRTVEAQVLQQVGAVVDGVLRHHGDPRFRPALEREWDRLRYPDIGELDATAQEVARVQARLAAVKRGLAQALAKRLAGGADGESEEAEARAEEYEAAAQILRDERRTLEAELERLGVARGSPANEPAAPALPSLDEALATFGGWADALATGDIQHQRAVLAFLLDRIVPERVGFGTYTVQLFGPVYEALALLTGSVRPVRGRRRTRGLAVVGVG